MACLEPVADPADPRLAPFRDLVGAIRRRRAARAVRDPDAVESGDAELVLVEGRRPIERLLAAGWELVVLALPDGDPGDPLAAAAPPGARVLGVPREVLRAVTGLPSYRACVAAARPRPWPAHPDPTLLGQLRRRGRSTIVLAERVTDPTNLGALVRNARAFGVDLLVADARGADPTDARAVRTSAGHVFSLPIVVARDLPATARALRAELGAGLFAAVVEPGAEPLGTRPRPPHLLLAVGTEDAGLSPALRAAADARITIPMARDVDSLNVAAAAAVLLHALR